MIKKEYKDGSEAREAIVAVADLVGRKLGNTLGPAGRNYFIPEGITNDGRTIIKHLRYPNEVDDSIVIALDEVAARTDKEVGDGTTTSVVVASELIKSILPKVPDLEVPLPGGESVMGLSRRLEAESERAIELLKKKKIDVTKLEELERVAFTSMEDRENGKIIAKTIFEAGKDSYTAIDEGFSGKLETNVMAGITAPLSVASPFMYTHQSEAIYENPYVLVANHVFEDYLELRPFLESMIDQKNNLQVSSLVIVGKQFSVPFVQQVAKIYSASKGQIRILLISNPYLEDGIFEDIAAFCDGVVVNTHPKTGKRITDIDYRVAGHVKKIIAGKETAFIGGRGIELKEKETTTKVQERVLSLRSELGKETSTKKREELEKRIAKLLGGIATIYVDAKTAVERVYLKLKVQDAMNSCKTALEGGMVKGGGISLKEVAEELGEESLLYKALKAPYDRIQQNAGGKLEITDEVMDSFLVAKAGIENAVSVVKILLTVEGIIANKEETLVDSLSKQLSGQ